MLRGSEMRVLQVLGEEKSVKEIAEDVGRSVSYTSEVVSRLEGLGLVRVRRVGRRKMVTPADNRAVELFQRIVHLYPHVDFPNLLTPKTMPLLYFLDRPASVAELADKTGDYRNTVNRILKRLLNRGVLWKRDHQYQLNRDFQVLNEFAREYVHLQHRQTLSRYTRRGVILWETLGEFLAQTPRVVNAEDFLPTGPRLYAEYDIPLFTRGRYHYLYSREKERVSPAGLVCHTLLIDRGARYQAYALLLIKKEKIHRQELLDVAQYYGVTQLVQSLITYLETGGEERPMGQPTWSEFEQLAEEYGVRL